MNIKQYKKVTKFYNYLIKKNLSYFTLALSSLNIIRSHHNYFDISKRQVQKKYLNIFIDYLSQNVNFLVQDQIKESDVLFISVANTNSKRDLFFENIISYFQSNNVSHNVLLRDFSSGTLINKNRKNFFYLKNKRNKFLNFYYLIKLLLKIIKISFYNDKKFSLKIKIFLNLLSIKNFKSSLFNLNHVNSIFNEIKKIKPKKVIFTYEGYPWEKMLNYKIKKFDSSIKTYGYFFSIISKYHNSPFIELKRNYDPDYILCAGKFSKKKFIKKKFNKKKIFIIGSNNFNTKLYDNKKLKNYKNKCLILPEAFNEEVLHLINYAKDILNKGININFILRLHPSTNIEFKTYIEKYIKNSKIKISNFKLEDDLKRSNIALYRGSSAIISAGFSNIIPVYIPKPNELTIDPLFPIVNHKPNINSYKEFIIFYNRLRKNKFLYNKKKMKIVKNFCANYFSNINNSEVKKLFL